MRVRPKKYQSRDGVQTMRMPAFIILGAVTLAGCQTTQDPCAAANRDVSFGSLLSNSASGSYSSCLEEKQKTLSRLRLEASLLDGEADRLRRLANEQSEEQRVLTQRLAEATERQATLARQIAASESTLSSANADVENILARERTLRARIERNSVSGIVTEGELRQIEAEQASIRSVLNALMADAN